MQGNPYVDRVSEIAEYAGSMVARDLIVVLRAEVGDSPEPSPWMHAVQFCRDTGILSDDVAYYLLAIIAESWAFERGCDDDAEIQRLTAEMDAIERREGLTDDEAFRIGEGPPDYERLRIRWDNRFDSLQSAVIRELGETELAMAVLRDDAGHRGRVAKGRSEIVPVDDAELEANGDEL